MAMILDALPILNRITVGLMVVSLAVAGWIAYQRLENNASVPSPAATHHP